MQQIIIKYRKEFETIEAKLRKRYNFKSLEFTLSLWTKFIDEVQSGYVGLIYDYENDLCDRDILQFFLDNSSADLKNNLLKLIEPLDLKFKEVTSEVQEPISIIDLEQSDPEKYFWYYRVPKKITAALEPDLDENGRK